MTPVLVAPAAGLAVPLEDARRNLKDPPSELDGMVTMWLKGITKNAEKIMQRSILHQEWLLQLPGFGSPLLLPMPPLVEVVHIKYFDANNEQQTLQPDAYRLDTASSPGKVFPAAGSCWPATSAREDAVEVRYKCGYGADAASTPDDIKSYLLAKLVEMFDPGTAPPTVGKPYTVSFIDSFLDSYRVY